MLHNRLSNLFQKETNRIFMSFLDDNPDLLKKYVSGSVAAIGVVLGSINVFMRHLLTVQGLDPDSIPGETQRAQLQEALKGFFSARHEEDFDADYDVSWVHKKFEAYLDSTDLSRLPNPISRVTEDLTPESIDDVIARVNPVAPESPKKELPISKKKLNKTVKVRRVPNVEPVKEGKSTLTVESDRKVRPPSTRTPGRDLRNIAAARKAEIKLAKESTPEFKAEMEVKLAAAKAMTDKLIATGFCDADDKAREEQIQNIMNWTDEAYAAMERLITKYAPTKDAMAENKFKDSFRRVVK